MLEITAGTKTVEENYLKQRTALYKPSVLDDAVSGDFTLPILCLVPFSFPKNLLNKSAFSSTLLVSELLLF